VKDQINKLISNLHVFIILYALYGAYVLWDEHSTKLSALVAQLPAIDEEIGKTETKVKEIQDFIKKTDEYKVRVEEVAKSIESVQKQLPADINDSQIITFFQKEIEVLNIRDASINPGKETTSMYWISKDYNLKASGTFLQFLIFFERVGTAARIYNVKNLKLVQSNTSQKGRFQLINVEGVIQAFRYNPEFKVDRGFETKAEVQ